MGIDLEYIESTIGYEFENLDLLQQAFVRKSYSEENGGQNNEVLEFIGDKALDLAVIKIMMDYFGKITYNKPYQELKLKNRKCFVTSLNEGQFTDIKKDLVKRKTLAKCMDRLGFHTQLIMGYGDKINNIQERDSVKEDLFEAIIGAVAIDSNWNMQIICDVVENMIDFENYFFNANNREENYVMSVQLWSQSNGLGLPYYKFEESRGGYLCYLEIKEVGLFEKAFGVSKSKAMSEVAKLAYEWLDDNGYLTNDLCDILCELTEEDSLRQVNELVQKGMIEEPKYIFSQKYDNNGNPIWSCRLIFEDEYYGHYEYQANSSVKKDAKKKAVFKLLVHFKNITIKKHNKR